MKKTISTGTRIKRIALGVLMGICVLVGIEQTKAQSGGAVSAALSTRGDQTVLVAPDGTVWGLGRNINGSLGDGTTLFRSGLVRMQTSTGNLSGALDVACGTNHTAVLMGNGTVWTVGLNSSGELGNGNTTSQRKAVQVLTASGPLTGVTALAAGGSHTLALSASGEVWVWGAHCVRRHGLELTCIYDVVDHSSSCSRLLLFSVVGLGFLFLVRSRSGDVRF